jgi:hypothetical protein
MATKEEKRLQIIELQGKNSNANAVWGSVSLLGSIGGVVLAHKMGYKFWGKVGFFFLGGMVTGLPMRLIYANKISERAAKISLLRNEIFDEESNLNKQQILQEMNNNNASSTNTTKQITQAQANALAFTIRNLMTKSQGSPAAMNKIKTLNNDLLNGGYTYVDGKAIKNVG